MARMAVNRAIFRIEPKFSASIIRRLDSPARLAADEVIRDMRRSVDEANRFVDELRQQLASQSSEIKMLLFPERT
jgi:hypothetical protein